uniref:Uncharacterized protein n=2 Tax=Culex quinquefasciatus TaxID=7176 RepID=A0A1S4KDN9_CULQU
MSTLVVAIQAETKICTTDPRCTTDKLNQKLLPHTECGQFLRCESGKACLYNCPTGLHFNTATGSCDWPHQACCDPKQPCVQESLPPSISVPAPSPVLMPPSTDVVVPPQP